MNAEQTSRPGIIIFLAAVLALIVCNIGLNQYYDKLLQYSLVDHPDHPITPLFLVNEVLMVLFFFSVALEIKFEYCFGVLQDRATRALPLLCALGGMVVPAGIYLLFEQGVYIKGWAVPVATDIAFSLAALMLVGRSLPPSIRVFLLSLAIFDDIGAIGVIAVYFSKGMTIGVFLAMLGCLLYLLLISRYTQQIVFYWIGLIGLGYLCFLGGIHTTIAGVLTAVFIPMREDIGLSAQKLNDTIYPYVMYMILPLFAFANAGFAFHDVMHVFDLQFAYGIFFGLVVGKPVGIGLVGYLLVRLGICAYPQGMQHCHLFAISFLCGIGFTMSLFIALLAFSQPDILDVARLSVLAASALSGLIGMLLIHHLSKRQLLTYKQI
ncbi:Na+/H+ antiporter NhaA [Gammaproteobacteria bacterium]|nr:Na+/H+ antiporter NhaA [Gammaproteobacteria bacterium]